MMAGLLFVDFQIIKIIKGLASNTNELYRHPFHINAAARDAKLALSNIRNENLVAALSVKGDDHSAYQTRLIQYEVALDKNLSIIESNFLGDMDKVREARKLATTWHRDRAELITFIVNEHNAQALNLIKTKGTPVYDELQVRIDYILDFSSKKAGDIAIQAQAQSINSQFELQNFLLFFAIFTLISGVATALMILKTIYKNDIKLQQANDDLRIAATAFEAKEGMFVTDIKNNILRVNHAFTAITGYGVEEVIGKNPRLLSSGRQNKVFYSDMWESINNAGTWEGEIWNRRKNGEVYPEYLTITAVKDVTGIVNNYVGTFTDITLSNAASEEIKNLAFFDPLTQLPNRRLLTDRLQQALVASARHRQKGALLFLDLDHFKTLNDTLGHDIGDMLLQQVAERLTQCVRAGDTVARIGGDEFVILIEGLSERLFDAAAHTEAVADKILTSLNQVYQLGTHEYFSSPSIGATLFIGHEIALEELLKHADIAMYDAKKAGRNMLRFFDPVMQETINKRAEMDRDLRIAIAQKQFRLYYQVQVDIEDQPLGAEALIRWIHPERGMVSPLNFIPLAEEVGLILPIGQWVVETACAQLKAWESDALTSRLTISINVSAKQFNQPDFAKQVQTTVQHYAINTNLLKLELTESMLLNNIEHVIITMVALETIGIRFSLDDFGTGYSSLQYLKMLPMNQLKIDQSFVRDITFDNNDKSIVSTVIAMANSLDMDVIAEGVETKEQRELLMSKGCEKYQGYLFGKPMPIEQFEATLLNA